jgi:hypothetical protein
MSQESIKFIIKQDGTVIEEVLGATSGECLKMTEEIEEKLGKVQTRSFKPEYYQKVKEDVSLHMHQNEN